MNGLDESLNSLSLDERLKQLAIAAQQHPPKSRERQKALARLITALQVSRKLVRPRRGEFQGFYEEVYAVALQLLFAHICEKIDTYDPKRGEVLQWVNFRLEREFFIKASREYLPTLPKGVDPKTCKRLTLDDLDKNNPHEVNPTLVPLISQQVLECFEEDPEGIFQRSHIQGNKQGNKDANFKFLAIKRLEGYSWEEISVKLDGIKVPTLSSFYQRCLTEFAPKIKEYLS
ncbi:MAG: sigma-70 family RNA polymerase sigma factor [Hydrococcus sp. SU_1_0]|nr:sigma-70 family RNA polymerase sigma factor [Hydrococcus sp. SU_1_0]NJM19299.1 sigma-70 family RNA polymerase sigma factor [Richelia sp. SM1_7_0]NJR16206.1 sigma-70 family RNA polymerase sigma factor [Calothrix sp. CSU_2_0]